MPYRGRGLGARGIAAGLAVACVGCATQPFPPPSPEDETQVWLAESPRRIAVRVESRLPEPVLRMREYHPDAAAEKAARGAAAGGFGSLYYGCKAGPLGCALGLMFVPFGVAAGAIVGAASEEPTNSVAPLGQTPAGAAVREIAERIDLAALLADATVAAAPTTVRHKLLRPEEGVAAADEGVLALAVTKIEFVGTVGDDPAVALGVEVAAQASGPGSGAVALGTYRYDSLSRRVSQWSARDGRLFREELAAASQSLARQVLPGLQQPAPPAARARVEAARSHAEDGDWREWLRVSKHPDIAGLDDFLARYPRSRYAPEARQLLADAASEAYWQARYAGPGLSGEAGAALSAVSPAGLPRKGDRFTYRWSVPGSTRGDARSHTVLVNSVMASSIVEEFSPPGQETAQWIHTRTGYVVPDGVPLIAPYLGTLVRLVPGMRLEPLVGFNTANCGGRARCWTVSARVVGPERVIVPAGTFDAVRVEVVQELVPEGQAGPLNIAFLSPTRVLTAWFAPQVSRAVKFSSRKSLLNVGEEDFDLELAAFQRE